MPDQSRGEVKLLCQYDNSNESLYQIAENRGLNLYTFDVVKKNRQGVKKDPLKQEVEKSADVLQLQLWESKNNTCSS